MLSYVFENRELKIRDICERCIKEFEFSTVRRDEEEVFLANRLLSIMIEKKYTRVLVKNENVSIQCIESIF